MRTKHKTSPIRITLATFALVAAAVPERAAEWRTQSFSGVSPQGFGFTTGTSGSESDKVAGKLFSATGFDTSPFGSRSLFANGTSARYADRIDDKWLLGIETSRTSLSPFGSPFASVGTSSLDLSTSTVKLGYDLGNFTPYVTTSATTVNRSLGLGASQFDAGILAQNPGFNAQSTARVGAGFNYNVNPNIQIGVGFSVGNGPTGLLGQ